MPANRLLKLEGVVERGGWYEELLLMADLCLGFVTPMHECQKGQEVGDSLRVFSDDSWSCSCQESLNGGSQMGA